MQLMKQRGGCAERRGGTVGQNDDLSFCEKRRRAIGTLGADALRDERKGMILDDLLNFARRHREIARAGQQPFAHAGKQRFICRAAQIHQGASGFHAAADGDEFRNQLLPLNDAAQKRDVGADGFAEALMRTEDDLLGFRFADGALFKPARIHHAGDGTALAQQDALTGKRVGDDVVHIRFEPNRQDGNGMRHQEGDALALRDVFSGIAGQIHARLENVFVDFPTVRHAVNRQQRGFKRTASESAQKDVRVVGREQPLTENAQIALQRRKKLDGGFRWNCHDSAHILSLF